MTKETPEFEADNDPKGSQTSHEVEYQETPELVDELDGMSIDDLFPKMNVDQSLLNVPEVPCIIEDDKMLNLYDEILDNCRKDRENVDEVLANFIEMVMNEGDASSASKEAIVNLIKIKSDSADKMSKVADLMTRIKLKERDTFPRYLAAQQNNKVVIEGNGSKREMLKTINKMTEKKKK